MAEHICHLEARDPVRPNWKEHFRQPDAHFITALLLLEGASGEDAGALLPRAAACARQIHVV